MVFLDTTPSPITQAPIRPDERRMGRVSGDIFTARIARIVALSVVVLSPLPTGGNHPLAWMFWSTLLGFYLTFLALRSDLIRVFRPAVNHRIITLAMAFFAFAGFQTLPLPGLTGGMLLDLPNISVMTNHVSISPGSTLLAAMRGCGYLIFFALILFAVRERHQAKTMGWLTFLAVTVHAILALISLQFFGGATVAGGSSAFPGAATGTFINKNSFATFLGLGLILGLCLVQSELSRKRSADRANLAIGLMALALISGTLLLTQSRLGITATFCAAVLVLIFGKSSRPVKIMLAVVVSGLAIAAAPILAKIGFFDLTDSAQSRLELYRQVLGMIAERPLLGFGLDSFALAYEPYHQAPVTAEFVWDKAHSTYLTLWVEAGLLFGSIPVAIGLLAARRLWALAKRPERGRSLALAGVGALVLSGLHSLGDFSLEIQANMFLLIAIVALGLSGNRTEKGTD